MAYKRILTIQDISCVGQCSLTVALPIISACGHETCVLPTALLSTHTSGFGKPVVAHFDDKLADILRHWQENDIRFDAVLVGYLGSISAVKMAGEIMNTMMEPDGISIVDPAFGDHGRIYSGLTEEYAWEMEKLCQKADIILPNVTEAAFFSGVEYREQLDEAYVDDLLKSLDCPCIIMTGVGFEEGKTGILIQNGEKRFHYSHQRIGKNCHGTGDMFAACFTGALLRGKSMEESVKIAADFVCRSIENTVSNPVHRYGVQFETVLPELIQNLQR